LKLKKIILLIIFILSIANSAAYAQPIYPLQYWVVDGSVIAPEGVMVAGKTVNFHLKDDFDFDNVKAQTTVLLVEDANEYRLNIFKNNFVNAVDPATGDPIVYQFSVPRVAIDDYGGVSGDFIINRVGWQVGTEIVLTQYAGPGPEGIMGTVDLEGVDDNSGVTVIAQKLDEGGLPVGDPVSSPPTGADGVYVIDLTDLGAGEYTVVPQMAGYQIKSQPEQPVVVNDNEVKTEVDFVMEEEEVLLSISTIPETPYIGHVGVEYSGTEIVVEPEGENYILEEIVGLPPGLSENGFKIEGIPTEQGVFTFTVNGFILWNFFTWFRLQSRILKFCFRFA